MPSKLQRFLSGGWNAMSAADTQIYYDGAWHDPCSGPKTMWHFKDGSWQKFPCVAGGVLYSCYHQNLYPDGPFPTLYTDYTMLAVADDTSQDVFIKPDPFHEQAYACWSPDYSKIVFMRGDRTQLSAGAWPESQDLTPPIPPNFGSTASKYELCVMDADGSNETVLVSDVFSEASVISPDNSMVAYIGHSSDHNRIYDPEDVRVVNIDGTGDRSVYTNQFDDHITFKNHSSRNPVWSADNQLVTYYSEQDLSGGSPFPYTVLEMRKYDPSDSSYVVIWDVLAYCVANSIDASNFLPEFDGHCGHLNNKHVQGWIHNVDTGLVESGVAVTRQSGVYFVIVECVAGATPTFINTEDVPWYNWAMFTNSVPDSVASIATTTSILDDFDRADSDDLGSDWDTMTSGSNQGVLSIVSDIASFVVTVPPQVDGFRTFGSMKYNAIGPLTDCEAYVDLVSPLLTFSSCKIGARVDINGDGYWVKFHGDNPGQLDIVKVSSGVETTLYSGFVFSFRPVKIGIQVYGDTISVWGHYGGVSGINWVNWAVVTDTEFSSGYLGISHSNDVAYDNFGGGSITVTPGGSYQQLANTNDQPWWNASNTEFMIHTEIADPSWGFRTWIAIALNPDTMESWSFAFSPNDPATIPRFGTDTGYTEADTTPPFAHDSYVPTWYGDKLAMTGMYNDPDTFGNDGDPESSSFSVFLDIAAKEKGGTPYWLALSRYPQGYTTDDFYINERMLITGIGFPTWEEDEELA